MFLSTCSANPHAAIIAERCCDFSWSWEGIPKTRGVNIRKRHESRVIAERCSNIQTHTYIHIYIYIYICSHLPTVPPPRLLFAIFLYLPIYPTSLDISFTFCYKGIPCKKPSLIAPETHISIVTQCPPIQIPYEFAPGRL